MNRFGRRLAKRTERFRKTIQQALRKAATNTAAHDPLLISDGQGWALDAVAAAILPEQGLTVDYVPDVRGKTLHFIDRYQFFKHTDPLALSAFNRVVVSWWHGGAMNFRQPHLDAMLQRLSYLAQLPVTYHITSSLYEAPLRERDIPASRIVRLPLGIHTARFRPVPDARAQLGLPPDAAIIGSFQRDGDHDSPKLVKGPDVFIEAVVKLRAQHRGDVLVLLTGPKRGYITAELERAGVPYRYDEVLPAERMPLYYAACDVYLVTSREEGGPNAILESMASGTPLVSTEVGIAVDVIRSGENGFLARVGDADALAGQALEILVDANLRERLVQGGLETAPHFDWSVLAPQYAAAFYRGGTP